MEANEEFKNLVEITDFFKNVIERHNVRLNKA